MQVRRNYISRLGVRIVALMLLVCGLAPGWQASAQGTSNALAQIQQKIGAVETVALDGSGNGWAWAGAGEEEGQNFLLRIENGTWRVGLESGNKPDVLSAGERINDIALAENGNDGWAVGSVCCNDTPAMWRLKNGVWSAYTQIDSHYNLYDITINADGSDGWLTAEDQRNDQFKLFRLRNGSWEAAALPASGGALVRVALSPNGKVGWGVGPRSESKNPHAQHAAYRLNNDKWEVTAGDLYMPIFAPLGLVADNLGNGWVITTLLLDMADRVGGINAMQANQKSDLWRLSANAKPKQVELNLIAPKDNPNAEFDFYGLAEDGSGRGWAAGSFQHGTPDDNPPVVYQPVFFRLQGENVTLTPNSAIGYDEAHNLSPLALGMTRDGAHTWVGSSVDSVLGQLGEIIEPWSHTKPSAATPLPGAGRCFAEVPNCLRGVFASYWAQKGGLDLFGYPITPEVQETIGGKSYLVQYTQRARFEYHPENKAPNDVLLGLLGNTLSEPRQKEDPFKPKPPGFTPSAEWFQETQHNVRPPFLDYWNKNGGLPVFGFPKSEAFDEKNAADGKVYSVQYFERNRLEYHPELKGTKFEMLLGLLGTEQFKTTYGYAP